MNEDAQLYFNVAIMIFGGLGGWILNGIRDSLRTLHDSDAALTEKLQGVEVLIAGHYVRRDEMERLTLALFAKLDKIESKLDAKADKGMCDQIHRAASGG